MSLNVRERHALRAIEERLTRSDPRLASLHGMFARLASGEEMPMRERARAGWRRPTRRQPGTCQAGDRQDVLRDMARQPIRRMGWQRAILLLWLVSALAMTATALALSHAGGTLSCAPPWTACASQSHAAGPRPAAPRPVAGHGSSGSSPSTP